MNTITIPKELTKKGELVVISRREYEEFLKYKFKNTRGVTLTAKQKRAIAEARKRIARGDFLTFDELESKLGFKNRYKNL